MVATTAAMTMVVTPADQTSAVETETITAMVVLETEMTGEVRTAMEVVVIAVGVEALEELSPLSLEADTRTTLAMRTAKTRAQVVTTPSPTTLEEVLRP